MKKLPFQIYAAVFALLTASAALLVYLQPGEQPVLRSQSPAIGRKDDPAARGRFEWKRLRNPATNAIPADIRKRELAFAKRLEDETAGLRAQMRKTSAAQTSEWTWRGPANLGGRTRALAIDVSNENVMLAGGVSGGMWRTTNSGQSWTKTTLPTELHSVTCIAQDTRTGRTSTWYYGTGEARGNSASGGASGAGSAAYRGDGIYKSTDGGQSWTLIQTTATGRTESFDHTFDYISNIVIDPSNAVDDELYVSAFGTIKRTDDGGDTWTNELGDFYDSSEYTDVAVTSGGVVYATIGSGGTDAGIHRSADGLTWTDITPADMPLTWNRVVIGISPMNENHVYFLGNTPGSGTEGHMFWKYDASTETWENRTANLPNSSEDEEGGTYNSQTSYNMLVKVKPGTETVFIGGVNLFRSTDGFATTENVTWVGGWLYENKNNHHADQHALVFLPSDPGVMYSGHDGGVSVTTDNAAAAVQWTSLNNRYNTTQFYTVALDRNRQGGNVVIGGMQDNGTWYSTSSAGSASWSEVPSGGDGGFCALTEGEAVIYSSSQNGHTYRFTNTTWARIDPEGGSGYMFITPFVLNPSNSDMVYLAVGGLICRARARRGFPRGLKRSGTSSST